VLEGTAPDRETEVKEGPPEINSWTELREMAEG
jgi:hypothetical protein